MAALQGRVTAREWRIIQQTIDELGDELVGIEHISRETPRDDVIHAVQAAQRRQKELGSSASAAAAVGAGAAALGLMLAPATAGVSLAVTAASAAAVGAGLAEKERIYTRLRGLRKIEILLRGCGCKSECTPYTCVCALSRLKCGLRCADGGSCGNGKMKSA